MIGKLLDAMETCHVCSGTLFLEETPVHCENCSYDCEDHEEPACTPLQTLHSGARKELAAIESERTQARADVAELVESLRTMLASAYPHPTEHPTMTEAWKIANAALAKHSEANSFQGDSREEA